MTTGEAFGYYYGIHLHFSSEKYSVIKYGIRTQRAIDKFNKLTEQQKFKFQWLAKTFQTNKDLIYACLGCELDDLNIQFADKQLIYDSYIAHKTRRESLTYHLKSELKRYNEDPNKEGIFFGYFSKIYSPEFTLLMDSELNRLDIVASDPAFCFAANAFFKLQKYRYFFNPTKYLHLLKNHEESVSSGQF